MPIFDENFCREEAAAAVRKFVRDDYCSACRHLAPIFYNYVKDHQDDVTSRLADYLTITQGGIVYDREKIITTLDANGTLLAHNILDILKAIRPNNAIRQAGGLSRTFHELGFVEMGEDGTRENNRLTLIGESNAITRRQLLRLFGHETSTPGNAKCDDYWIVDIYRIYLFCVYVELSGLRLVRHDYHTHSQTGRKKNVAVDRQPIVWHVRMSEYGYHGYPSGWTQTINNALDAIPYATYDNLNLKTKAGETIDSLDCRVAYGVEFEVGSRLTDNQIFQIDMARNNIMADENIDSIRMHDGSLGGGTETVFVPASADKFIRVMQTMSKMVKQALSPRQKARDIELASTHTTVSIAFPDTDLGLAIKNTRVKNTTFQARLLIVMNKINREFTRDEIIRLFGRYFTGYAAAPWPSELARARSNNQAEIDSLCYIHNRAASVHGLPSEYGNAGRDNGASMYELRLPNRKCNPQFIRDFGFITMLLDYNYFDKQDLYDKTIALCRKYLQD